MFDVSSPNGFLLFRETSKMMVTYGSRILTMGDSIPKDSLYSHKLKVGDIWLEDSHHGRFHSYVSMYRSTHYASILPCYFPFSESFRFLPSYMLKHALCGSYVNVLFSIFKDFVIFHKWGSYVKFLIVFSVFREFRYVSTC